MNAAALVNEGSSDTFAALITSGRFGKPRYSLRRARTGKTRDFADLGFFDFVGAAFARSRGTHVVATQRVSPFRPFKSVILGGTETVLSLHGVWTRKTRT